MTYGTSAIAGEFLVLKMKTVSSKGHLFSWELLVIQKVHKIVLWFLARHPLSGYKKKRMKSSKVRRVSKNHQHCQFPDADARINHPFSMAKRQWCFPSILRQVRGGFRSLTQEDWVYLSTGTDLLPLSRVGWSKEPCRLALATTLPERQREVWEYNLGPWIREVTEESVVSMTLNNKSPKMRNWLELVGIPC